jgi:hypothetical protein
MGGGELGVVIIEPPHAAIKITAQKVNPEEKVLGDGFDRQSLMPSLPCTLYGAASPECSTRPEQTVARAHHDAGREPRFSSYDIRAGQCDALGNFTVASNSLAMQRRNVLRPQKPGNRHKMSLSFSGVGPCILYKPPP